MVDDQIVDWIKENQSKGYTDEQLRSSLLQRYAENDVNDAFSAIAGTPAATPSATSIPSIPSAAPKEKKSKKKLWMIIGGAVLIIGIILFVMSLNRSGQTQNLAPQQCTENWACTNLSSPGECIEGQQQVRICVDRNSCGIIESKPSEKENCIEFGGIPLMIMEGEEREFIINGNQYVAGLSMVSEDSAVFNFNGESSGKIGIGESYTFSDGSKITLSKITPGAGAFEPSTVEFTLS